jgi:methylglutaconyl-CoA hydratase
LIICRVQGKTVGGGVGLLAACDYVLATEQAAIKLSEISIGIGPFVIAPPIERKMGLAALSELTLDATSWKNAHWAKEKGLYANVFETLKELDDEVQLLASKLVSYNPNSLKEIKKVFWQNTNHWNELLMERAEITGKLVLSDFTKNALANFSNK